MTTELRVVLVGAIFGLNDQLAVGEVGIVRALPADLHILDHDVGRVRGGRVAVIGRTRVRPRVESLRALDSQGVAAIAQHADPSVVGAKSPAVLRPEHGRRRHAVHATRNRHHRVEGETRAAQRDAHLHRRKPPTWRRCRFLFPGAVDATRGRRAVIRLGRRRLRRVDDVTH